MIYNEPFTGINNCRHDDDDEDDSDDDQAVANEGGGEPLGAPDYDDQFSVINGRKTSSGKRAAKSKSKSQEQGEPLGAPGYDDMFPVMNGRPTT